MLTLAIIVVTSIISFIAFGNRRLLERLILWPPAVSRQHQYDRLVTYGLVHADPTHLLFNMITLYFFGQVMEKLDCKGIEISVRVIPDPSKDIGLSILSTFHSRNSVRIVTCTSMVEAARVLDL